MAERLEEAKKLLDDIAYYNRVGSRDLEILNWLIEQIEKVERYENALKFIVNVDGWFTGKDLEFDNETALDLIDKTAKKALAD